MGGRRLNLNENREAMEDIWTQEKVTEAWRKRHNEFLYDIHFPPNTEPIIRSRRIRHVHVG